jgi:outer membrane protein assembly factor BamA
VAFERLDLRRQHAARYALPLNSISDFDTGVQSSTACDDPTNCLNAGNLENIDDDIRLPLTERYFLGGLGTTRIAWLPGRIGRTATPRAQVHGAASGRVYHPVGTRLISNPRPGNLRRSAATGSTRTTAAMETESATTSRQGIDDFEDLNESQVIGGNSYISSSFEYRFPISEEIGLLGIGFSTRATHRRKATCCSTPPVALRYGRWCPVVLPFGPLQLVLGFPIDPRETEQSPVFEFSVGGLGI